MKAIVVGAVDSTRIALRCLAASPAWEVAALFTLPLDLAPRHSDFLDLEDDAAQAGAAVHRVANSNAPDAIAALSAIDADYIFVIGWSQICGQAFRAAARHGVIGYHPAPLPRLRGRAVIPWTILLDEPITASSLFLIDEGVDSGPLLAQHYFHLAPDETAATLYAKHMARLEAMLPQVLGDLAAGRTMPKVQDERCATYAARRRPEDGRIDWAQPATTVWRTVRACGAPYPGAWTTLGKDAIVIDEAVLVPLDHHAASLPGQIVEKSGLGFTVRCGDGQGLRVLEWRTDRAAPLPNHVVLGREGAGA